MAVAEVLKERAKDGIVIRMWATKNDGNTDVNVVVVQTFTTATNESIIMRSAGFQPFGGDRVFVCEAKFSHGPKLFGFSANAKLVTPEEFERNFSGTTMADCEKICTIPRQLQSIGDRCMFIDESGVLRKTSCLASNMALALTEQALCALPREASSNYDFALWCAVNNLNKIVSEGWQEIISTR